MNGHEEKIVLTIITHLSRNRNNKNSTDNLTNI